jgi:hypothetical protein
MTRSCAQDRVSIAVAFAHGCRDEMKKIDEKMPTAKLSAADQTKVKELRTKGEQLH